MHVRMLCQMVVYMHGDVVQVAKWKECVGLNEDASVLNLSLCIIYAVCFFSLR